MLIPLTSRIRKSFTIALTLLCACAGANAQQTNCSIKLEQLSQTPELLGFRLGMTFAEVRERVPVVQFGRADAFGVAKTTINPHFDPRLDPAEFKSVRSISFDFLDGKLVRLWIGFEETFKWPKLDEFVSNYSKALGVPAVWPVQRSGRQLTCDGFTLFASIIAAGPSIRITDDASQNLIARRREEALEAAEVQVIGDQRTKSYYPADCEPKEAVPAISQIIFKNKDEAEKSGYKLARECH